jgi:hypothetical protein
LVTIVVSLVGPPGALEVWPDNGPARLPVLADPSDSGDD